LILSTPKKKGKKEGRKEGRKEGKKEGRGEGDYGCGSSGRVPT
jgi:hypothetical protein